MRFELLHQQNVRLVLGVTSQTAAAVQVSGFVGFYVLFLSMSSSSENGQRTSAYMLHSAFACSALLGGS